MKWRTANNRRAGRTRSNALTITVWRNDGTVAQHGVHPLPNAHVRAMIAWMDRVDTAEERRRDIYREVVEAVGEIEADRLIVCEFGTAEVAHAHLVSIGSIELEAA